MIVHRSETDDAPVVRGKRGDYSLALANRDLSDGFSGGRDDGMDEREHVVLGRNAGEVGDDRMETERFLRGRQH